MRDLYNCDWPDHATDLSIELACALHNHRPEAGGLGAQEHYLKALKLVWPDELGDKGYTLHSWALRRQKALLNPDPRYRFQTWWGPSAAGKSRDLAAYALMQVLMAPSETCVLLVSTTKEALGRRAWGYITELFATLSGKVPFKLVPNEMALKWIDPATGKPSTQFGIFCLGIQNTTLKDAMGNMFGTHPPRLILIIDEMQATKQAAVGSIPNLSTARFFQFIGAGNPTSHYDPLVLYSEPWNAEKAAAIPWHEHPKSVDEWETRYGMCLWFDGLTSPAILEPDGENKFGYLIKQRDMDQAERWFGRNSPAFWTQRRGYCPPEGIVETVLSETFIDQHGMRQGHQWVDGYTRMASCDPAFSSKGDRCMFSPFRYGRANGTPLIHFEDYVQILIEPGPGETITGLLARRLREECVKRGIRKSDLSIDCTGSQIGVADMIDEDRNWPAGDVGRVHRVYFNEKPTDRRVAVDDKRPCNKVFKNRVAELWYMMYHFGRFNQIRGLSPDDCREFCSRLVINNLPFQLESKEDMTGRSPDLADSRVVGLDHLRSRGVVPGENVPKPQEASRSRVVTEEDLINDEENYLHGGL